MAWGDKKEALIAENAAMTREIEILRELVESLKEEKIDLTRQLRYTQDALIAKESPGAYNDRKYEEEQALTAVELTPEQLEAKRLQNERAEIAARYINEMESPLFKNADDMIQMLTRVSSIPVFNTESLHGNDDS